MRFSTSRLQENGLDIILLKDNNSGTSIEILPLFGASLHAFNILADGKNFNLIDNYKNIEEAQIQVGTSFKSSKLSPFPCRIPNGKYFFDKKEYELKIKFMDGSAIHGLLYNKIFEVVDEFSNDQMASLILKYDYNHDDPGYPFQYRCEIRYLLKTDNSLKIETVISNQDEKILPVADGWHPYFRLGGNVNNWTLQFSSQSLVEFDENLIPTGKLSDYNFFNQPKKIGELQLDNCFVLRKPNGKAICEMTNPENNLKLSFFTDETYPYLQIYTPPDRQSIAIENLSGAPNCFNNKMGLTLLQPHHSQTFRVQYLATIA